MIRMIIRSGLVVAVAAGITSCIGGSGAGQPVTGAAIGNVMSTVATNVLNKLPTSNTAPNPPATGVGLSWRRDGGSVYASVAADCETMTPSTPTDADADGIALQKSSVFNCTDQISGGNSLTRKGSMTVRDLNDAVAGVAGGMSVDFNITQFDYVDNTSGTHYTNSFVGNWKFSGLSGSTLTSSSEFGGHTGIDQTSGIDVDYDYTYTWNWTQTPDNTAAPWNTGKTAFEGMFRMSGLFDIEDHSGNHTQGTGSYKVKYYSQNLQYDTACAKWYRSGSVFINDYNNSTFEIRYNCATAKFYVNGIESTAYTP